HAQRGELSELLDDRCAVLGKQTLGDLERQRARWHAGGVEDVPDKRGERRVVELAGRDVDADRDRRAVGELLVPLAGLLTGGPQDPRAERHDQPGFLGERYELGRRNPPALWMRPPNEGLDAVDAPGLQVHDRLIFEPELLLVERLLEL